MTQIYFEAYGEAILDRIGMSKSEFARRMGIRKQNVRALFKTKNLETLYKASEVLDVPITLLIGYIGESNLERIPIVQPEEEDEDVMETEVVTEDDIPMGDTTEDKRRRHKIILEFYHYWKRRNPDAKKYNLNLKDYINIRYISLEETAGHASSTYLSTLAVLQLDAILTNAVLIEQLPANPKKHNQKGFERLLRMSYNCPGIGVVMMYVGVKRSDKSKVQYCITAIDARKTKQEAR